MNFRKQVLLGLLGAYLNSVAFGFRYGIGNHDTELAVVKFFRDPSLYPSDSIREAFRAYPSFFWHAVAFASNWADTRNVIILAFVITKIVFFLGLARLVAKFITPFWLNACIVFSIALARCLSRPTPFGYSNILDPIQTHTSLAIAVLLWVGVFLIEEKWIQAGVMFALAIYINQLFCMYVSISLFIFAMADWSRRKRQILWAAAVVVLLSSPAALSWRSIPSHAMNQGFVQALLQWFPFHYKLSSHPIYEIAEGMGFLAVALCFVLLSRRIGVERSPRLELLAGSYLLPVGLGAVAGDLFTSPYLIAPSFLRADSFLFFYSVVLIQIYAAQALLSPRNQRPSSSQLILFPAIFLSLSAQLKFTAFVLIGCLLIADPTGHLESVLQRLKRTQVALVFAPLIVVGAVAAVKYLGQELSPGLIVLVVTLLFCLLGGQIPQEGVQPRGDRIWLIGYVVVLTAVAIMNINSARRFLNPNIPPNPMQASWHAVQEWARAKTPQDSKFIVPPFPGGFRVLSERTIWVSWKDGDAINWYPPYASLWGQRMTAIGAVGIKQSLQGPFLADEYKQVSWQDLISLAHREKLDYIVQFKEAHYAATPVFENIFYAVYRVPD